MLPGMRLTALGSEDLTRLDAALRSGASCTLSLSGPMPPELKPSQVLPWFDRVEVPGHRMAQALEQHLPIAGSDGPPITVTAVIPTHRQTPIGLQALRDQDVDLDVLVLSNGDARPQGDRVLRVPWTGHGPTRQRGVQEATGDYVLLTVDDALPRGRGCVRAMVNALEAGGYDAVYGRQVPWPGADAVTRARLAEWTPAGRGHWATPRFDHVFALYRRRTLLAHPLPAVPIGEDLHWSRGRRIGYVPGAVVIHSHTRNPGELFRRTRDLHLQHQLLGDAPTVPSVGALLRALPGAVVRPTLRGGPREAANQVAELLGQWRATKLKGDS